MLTRHDLRSFSGDYASVLPRPLEIDARPLEAVRSIIADVRARGDKAIAELGERFDGAAPNPLAVSRDACDDALSRVPAEVVDSLRASAASIRDFHQATRSEATVHRSPGLSVEARVQPVDRAGCYAPGGRAAYPSTVLMTAVPARTAGVDEVVLCVPPKSDGRIADVTLAAAAIAEVDMVFAVGGAQAVAAMAFGTDTIRPVDVIVGPGNVYVAIAKQEVSGVVRVPAAFAGPSEICVLADGSVDPRYAAIDLLVQAEHGPDGLSWLIATDESVVTAVEAAMAELLADAPRKADIEATLARGGHVALVSDHAQGVDVANVIAPEHLQLMVDDADEIVDRVRHAGAVFIGPLAPASLGDYMAGPSHVLPTNGSARFGGALGVEDFCKHVHIVRADQQAFEALAPHVAVLADAEGLDAHAESVRLRLRDLR